MVKRRILVSIFISMLLTLSLTTCASAVEAKLTASASASNDYFGYSVSISGNETILCEKLRVDLTVKYN